jgi:hypothetical protein
MKSARAATFVMLALSLAVLSACDPSKALNQAFAKLGLTRLATVRNDVFPGALIVSSKNNAIFADNITDYVPKAKLPFEFQDNTKVASGYIPQIEGSSNIEPKIALDIIKTVFPISGSADFKFTSNVKITQMNCSIKRVPIPSVRDFLKDSANVGLSEGLRPYFDDKSDVFVAYEVWSSSKIDFSSDTGTDITASVKVGEVQPISSGSGSLTIKRTSKETLSISADQPYTFAVKLMKIERDPANGNLKASLGNFKSPSVTKGPDDQYVFVTDEMQGIAPKRVPPAERLSALQ